jgi:hypothetical protein
VIWRFVAGNHDTDGIAGTIDMLSDIDDNIFITKPFYEEVEGVNVFYLPWTKDIQDTIIDIGSRRIKGQRNVLFTHCATSNALSDTGYKLRNAEVSTPSFRKWTYVGLGDYHMPQWVVEDKVAYSGSIIRFNQGERDHKKSFIHGRIDSTLKSIKRIGLPDIDFIQLDILEKDIKSFLKTGYKGPLEMTGALVQARIHVQVGSSRPGSILFAVKRDIMESGAWKAYVSWKIENNNQESSEEEGEERIELDVESACVRNLRHNEIEDESYLNYIKEIMNDESL